MKLSDRLTTVFQNLLPQKDVWDVCCDHGYLGIAAYQSEKFNNIYFVDRVSTIIEQLHLQFNKHAFRSQSKTLAHFICENAEKIKALVSGTFCVTGVGGLIIFKILEGLSSNGFLNADRLILGPHRDELKLIELIKHSSRLKQYHLQSQVDVMENDRVRSIFILDRLPR